MHFENISLNLIVAPGASSLLTDFQLPLDGDREQTNYSKTLLKSIIWVSGNKSKFVFLKGFIFDALNYLTNQTLGLNNRPIRNLPG